MSEILIIEDDLRLRSEIERYLKTKGHEVTTCADGTEGLKTIKEVAFDVILLDVKLPGMMGTDVLKEIAQTLPFHPPVILITGHGDKETAIKAVHFGAFDFVEKPFTPHALDFSIERATQQKKEDVDRYRAMLNSLDQEDLTQRENEVAHLASQGLSNEEIASRLQLSAETVKTHLKKVFRKLGVSNRTALTHRLKKAA